MLLRLIIFFCVIFTLQSCQVKDHSTPGQLFTLLDTSDSGITFSNDVEYTEDFNMYTFRNFYNGAGVAIGDINNDGLADIYFCGNMNGNRLYLNKGELKFEDITKKANVSCGEVWSTGVSMIDINGDGWLDLYVCKSGKPGGTNRSNELFINNQDLTFSERSKEYGLAVTGLSTHAVFFDYDKDGDLDCYLLTNSIKSVDNYDLVRDQRKNQDPQGGGNKLMRNDGGKFVDVTQQAQIYSSAIGFGLGVSIGDLNKDGWMDIYVSNDFFERDYLYLNAGDGSFREAIEEELKSLSMGSMGADIADINNDSYPDIFVTEMLPQTNERVKTKVSFENWNRYQMKIDAGYFYQYPRNVLQLNNADGTFSEIGRLGELDATDWSWGALIFDADNDGQKDIYVSNGIFKDLLDQDYINFMANPETVRSFFSKENGALAKMIDMIPSHPISNVAFKNLGNLRFEKQGDIWGLNNPGFSNGSAYGDLDNDGDLDLIVNNINMPAFIYRNNTSQILPENHFIEFILKGKGLNDYAIGTKITIHNSSQIFYCEQNPVRGFMSSVDSKLHVGLGKAKLIEKIKIEWPSGSVTELDSVPANQVLTLSEK